MLHKKLHPGQSDVKHVTKFIYLILKGLDDRQNTSCIFLSKNVKQGQLLMELKLYNVIS